MDFQAYGENNSEKEIKLFVKSFGICQLLVIWKSLGTPDNFHYFHF